MSGGLGLGRTRQQEEVKEDRIATDLQKRVLKTPFPAPAMIPEGPEVT